MQTDCRLHQTDLGLHLQYDKKEILMPTELRCYPKLKPSWLNGRWVVTIQRILLFSFQSPPPEWPETFCPVGQTEMRYFAGRSLGMDNRQLLCRTMLSDQGNAFSRGRGGKHQPRKVLGVIPGDGTMNFTHGALSISGSWRKDLATGQGSACGTHWHLWGILTRIQIRQMIEEMWTM